MSTTPDSSTEPVALSHDEIRAAYDPFEHGCWMDYANRVTQGYMDAERDSWAPLGDHHSEWLELFNGSENFCMLCHRDGLKTTITLVYLTACLEYLDGFRAHWLTNTRSQAHKKAHTELNKLIDRNPWLQNLNNRVTDNKEEKEFGNGSMLYSGWLFGGIEGDRSHLLILDDIIKEHGDGDTDRIRNWIQGVTIPMVKENGKSAIIGTRKRNDDVYTHFRDQDGYLFREFPAILDVWDQEFRDDDDWRDRRPDPSLYTEVPNPFTQGGETIRVLWPEARGPKWLDEKFDEMSPYLFWREYCMVITAGSGNLIDKGDVNTLAENGGCSIRGESPPRTLTPGEGEFTLVAHDPAQSSTGDNAAFVAIHVGRDGRRTLLDCYTEKGMSPSKVKATLADYNDRFDPVFVVIENNGIQQYVENDAIEFSPELRAKVKGLTTTGRKHSWENGIPRLRTLVERGSMQLYRGHDPSEDFIQAMLSLELKNGRLDGHTPDLIAAWFMTEKAIQRLEGLDVTPGEEEDEEDGDDEEERDETRSRSGGIYGV